MQSFNMYSLNLFIMISSLNALTVFDPDGENHEEYKKIHKSYKDMVRKLYFLLLVFALCYLKIISRLQIF